MCVQMYERCRNNDTGAELLEDNKDCVLCFYLCEGSQQDWTEDTYFMLHRSVRLLL